MISRKAKEYLLRLDEVQTPYYDDIDLRFQDCNDNEIREALNGMAEPKISKVLEVIIGKTKDAEKKAHLMGFESEFDRQTMIARVERLIKEIRE